MKKSKLITTPDDIAARYAKPDQAERFDGVVQGFGLSKDSAAQFRREADAIPPNHRRRQGKGNLPHPW